MKCLFCGKNKFKKISNQVRDSNSHKIVKCEDCGLLQIWPLPSLSEEREFYAKDRQAKNIKAPADIKTIKNNFFQDNERRSKMISKNMSKKSRILDVGSGYGFFLQAMLNKGFKNIVGLEISRERRNISKKITKAKVLDIDLLREQNLLESEKFDCITLFHVLEHIRDPISFLENIKKILKPRGALIIEVPNCKDMLLSVSKEYRDFYWQLAHLSYFSEKTLKEIIKNSGFVLGGIIMFSAME